ncbi:hypothetical protein MNB_SV-6-1426 [hydrothermal vent metagenome]|uniref:Uncharacterized protein n=1 Tax=hydrothermal vent metagenome TaxID=652676 RepID=A0A1W1BLW7_9ZZZZ
MKYILMVSLILFSIFGCESKEEIERAKRAEAFKQELIAKAKKEQELKAQEAREAEIKAKKDRLKRLKEAKEAEERAKDPSLMNELGLSMYDGKLIIDTNKTKKFFSDIGKKLSITDRELKDGNLTITKDAGVEITEDSMSIDFNKTGAFLESLGKKIETFSKEFDNLSKSFYNDEKNNTKRER